MPEGFPQAGAAGMLSSDGCWLQNVLACLLANLLALEPLRASSHHDIVLIKLYRRPHESRSNFGHRMTARILIVDDVPANTRLLEAKLAAEYYQVGSARDGFEALTLARR